jgi:predicted 3-demethylubiquinone-9 3-methyltransferase (glyoxalase superfamily)
VPHAMQEMLMSADRPAARRAMDAMLPMGKLDVAKLREAFDGVPA